MVLQKSDASTAVLAYGHLGFWAEASGKTFWTIWRAYFAASSLVPFLRDSKDLNHYLPKCMCKYMVNSVAP